MKFYSKRLKNIKDLGREKKKLQKQLRRQEKEAFLFLGEISLLRGLTKSDSREKEESNKGAIVNIITGINPIAGTIAGLVQNLVRKKKNKQMVREQVQQVKVVEVKPPTTEYVKVKKEKNALEKLAWEVLGGYLKWKALELSFKGAKYLMRKRREKKLRKELEMY
jgi:hypothetical protein